MLEYAPGARRVGMAEENPAHTKRTGGNDAAKRWSAGRREEDVEERYGEMARARCNHPPN